MSMAGSWRGLRWRGRTVIRRERFRGVSGLRGDARARRGRERFGACCQLCRVRVRRRVIRRCRRVRGVEKAGGVRYEVTAFSGEGEDVFQQSERGLGECGGIVQEGREPGIELERGDRVEGFGAEDGQHVVGEQDEALLALAAWEVVEGGVVPPVRNYEVGEQRGQAGAGRYSGGGGAVAVEESLAAGLVEGNHGGGGDGDAVAAVDGFADEYIGGGAGRADPDAEVGRVGIPDCVFGGPRGEAFDGLGCKRDAVSA